MKSYYYPDAVYLHGWGALRGGLVFSPCGGSITGSFFSRSRYQCGAILPADVCVDAVQRLSVGRSQVYVPACCIILRYKLHYFFIGG